MLNLCLQFLLPLPPSNGWRQDEHPICFALIHEGLENHPGLNGLSQSHFVGDEYARRNLSIAAVPAPEGKLVRPEFRRASLDGGLRVVGYGIADGRP